MLAFQMKENLGLLGDHLTRIARHDPIGLCRRIQDILIQENARGLSDGVDANGQPMAELRPSTIERGRGGFGPPLVPRFSSSRLISGFEVAIAKDGESGYLIRAGWPSVPFAIYHQRGTRHMVARPIAGFRPSTNAQIDEALRQEARSILDGLT